MSTPILKNELCFAIYSASNHITRIYRPLLESLDLTYPQFIVLMALWEQDNISISALANKTSLGKATMTPLLRRLEEKQLIKREMLPDNERQKNVVLTASGRALSKQSSEVTKQAFCATGLTRAQADEMIALCKLLTNRE